MRSAFQILDDQGKPRGGRVFEAPDAETLAASQSAAILPAGWTMQEVDDESQILDSPPDGAESN